MLELLQHALRHPAARPGAEPPWHRRRRALVGQRGRASTTDPAISSRACPPSCPPRPPGPHHCAAAEAVRKEREQQTGLPRSPGSEPMGSSSTLSIRRGSPCDLHARTCRLGACEPMAALAVPCRQPAQVAGVTAQGPVALLPQRSGLARTRLTCAAVRAWPPWRGPWACAARSGSHTRPAPTPPRCGCREG